MTNYKEDRDGPHRLTVVLPGRISRGLGVLLKREEITTMSDLVKNQLREFLIEKKVWDLPDVRGDIN